MNCEWDQYLRILPLWMREEVNRAGKDKLLELRLRLNLPPEMVFSEGSRYLKRMTQQQDLNNCINAATGYSPWASETVSRGYITVPGGHRIGICGTYINTKQSNQILRPSMLCLRVARDFPGIAKSAATTAESTLILGRPGSGKTTLLRDLIRQYGSSNNGSIAVVDEREELFPRAQDNLCFSPGTHTDVLSGCGKLRGIEMVLRSMTPAFIAVDEITAKEDCEALLHAGWCGVRLLATAHATDTYDLRKRPIYRPLIESNLFQRFLIMKPDKTWYMERSAV
ncbi:MAG: stage III sporulation protein AB [Oscillospiraceae bacterium]|nr:stage III sporulation protein AB [Oscillospiraceae bacterium]